MEVPKKYNTIRYKIFLIVTGLTVLYSLTLITYFNFTYRKSLLKNAEEKSVLWVRKYADLMRIEIEAGLELSNNTAGILSSKLENEKGVNFSRKDVQNILFNSVKNNDFVLGMYCAWEPNAFDGKDSLFAKQEQNHPEGHFVPYYYKDSQGKIGFEPLKYYLDPEKGDYYLNTRASNVANITEPFKYKIGDREVMLTSLVYPIKSPNGEFKGVVGTDISIDYIQKLADNNELFEGYGDLTLISAKGTIVAASGRKEKAGTKFSAEIFSSVSGINTQKSMIVDDSLRITFPLKFGEAPDIWYIIVKIPVSKLTEGLNGEILKLTLLGILFLLFLITSTSLAIKRFLSPISDITDVARKVAQGNLDVPKVTSSTNEIGELNHAFEMVIESQKEITRVIKALAEGDFSQKVDIKSNEDVLSLSLNQMTEKMQKVKIEDTRREWTNVGFAKFSELLRVENKLEQLCNEGLIFLIRYLHLNQGNVFLIEEEGKKVVIKLKAAYAYDRVKFIQKTIEPGEGLVGQVYLEKETILLTEIPDRYTYITSGLGDATPSCIVLIPLIYNEKIEGVVELASFKKLEKFEVEFLEKCCTLFASVISSIKISELTMRLLEESQDHAEQMKMQEEEMRQNMEELMATQEEMMRKEQEYLETIEALKRTS